ncbi:MAG: cell division protease FtsH [Cellvibrionaceae bacterium]|jgi:cell division protease FtsH
MSDVKKSDKPSAKNQPPSEASLRDIWFHQLSWFVLMFLLAYYWLNTSTHPDTEVPYSTFKTELVNNNIGRLEMRGERLNGQFKEPLPQSGIDEKITNFFTIAPNIADEQLMPLIEEHQVTFTVKSTTPSVWVNLLINILPWVLLIGFFAYTSRVFRHSLKGGGNGIFGFTKSRAKKFDANTINKRFTDVAGLENAKKDLQEMIDFLRKPEKYRQLGAKIPKGILMMGPPGCGKTLLAKATAGEAGVPFFSVTGSEFIEMYVGVGASRVRDMFEAARKQAPALVFIDEIDSIGRVRGTGVGGGHDEREQTLNQILAEMDGFDTQEAVIVLAATNRPDILDPALLRPGRFDRKLVLELPQRQARIDILKVHCQGKPLADDVDLEQIAAGTVGFSGADLANLVNEAALRAAHNNQKTLGPEDFAEARDKVALGTESGELLTAEEKERVAYHECGHALMALLIPGVDPLNKISIIPRGRALGVTEQTPTEDRHNFTQTYLENRLCILLGGRCAELVIYAEYSSGASDDLKKASELARKMITEWGMSKELGPLNLQQSETHPFLGKEMAAPRQFSEIYAERVDDAISNLLKKCEQKATALLVTNKKALITLAAALKVRETLDRQQIDQCLPELLPTTLPLPSPSSSKLMN